MAEERTAPDVQRMGLQAEKIWREAERRIMEDVIRRIRKTGEHNPPPSARCSSSG